MVRIRLSRKGYKNNPVYRIIVINQHARREGRPLEELGYYNPIKKVGKMNKGSYLEWLSKGATASETVKYIVTLVQEDGSIQPQTKDLNTSSNKLSRKAKSKLTAAATEA